MKELLHDIRLCIHAAVSQWKFCRQMRQGANPDDYWF
jgi:hypothetical protein